MPRPGKVSPVARFGMYAETTPIRNKPPIVESAGPPLTPLMATPSTKYVLLSCSHVLTVPVKKHRFAAEIAGYPRWGPNLQVTSRRNQTRGLFWKCQDVRLKRDCRSVSRLVQNDCTVAGPQNRHLARICTLKSYRLLPIVGLVDDVSRGRNSANGAIRGSRK